jgi:uncharacterized repeat protein (TIGR01451 family)
MKVAIFRFVVVAAIAALMVIAGGTRGWAAEVPPPCSATFPSFTPDFSSNQSCLAPNGAQSGTVNGAYPTFLTTNPAPGVATVLRLTPNANFWSASAWFTAPQPVSSRFSTSFQFQLSNGSTPPADGIAFVIQNSPSGTLALDIGGTTDGCGLGFGEQMFENGQGNCTPGSGGIPNSVAVEFDTFQNTDINDVSNNHVAIQSCGASPNTVDSTCRLADNDLTKLPNPINMADGNIHSATINYTPATTSGCGDGGTGPCPANIDVILDGVDLFPGGIAFDMTTIGLTNGNAYVGFTAGTGGSYEDQDILSWTFTSITGQPMNPNNPNNLTQPFVFNNTTNEHVEFDFDYTTSFNNNDLTVVENTVPTVSSQCTTQATYQSMVEGTSLATTSCFIAPGEGTDSKGNPCCAQFTLECTNQNSPSPAGDNCPQSTQRDLLFSHALDISPALTSIPAGTGPSLAEGSDIWSPGNCVFEGPEAGNLCPQSLLTQLFAISSDPKPGGTGKTSNSTFIAGCCQPEWSTAPNVPLYYNNTTVPVSFTSSPPAAPSPNPNNWVAAPNQSITWGWEDLGATPDPTFPIPGDQTVPNQTACPSNWPPVGTVPPNATASGFVTVPSEGEFEVHFFSTGCDDQEELQFTVQTDPSKNWAAFKTAPFNVDTTKPQVSSVTLNPPGGFYAQNSSPTATVTCTDPSSTNSVPPNYFSGIAQCGQQGSPQIFANPQTVTTTPISLNTATLGTQTFTAFAQDAAGNFSTSPVSYTVVGSADLAVGMIGNIAVKSGTNMTYLIGIVNNGPNTADLVTLTDTLPAGTTFVSSGYAIESCTIGGGRPICNISPPTNSCGSVPGSCSIGALSAWTKKNPIGVLVQITVNVNASSGRIENIATTGEANSDPNLKNDTAIWYTIVLR